MKKLFLIGVLLTLFGAGGAVLTARPSSTVAQEEQARVATDLTELIDNIAVPYGVLLDAQMEHPGYAVMGASKINRAGKDSYRLHIQSSDVKQSRTNLYLIYDMEWRLMGEETSVEPPPVQRPKEQPVNEPQPEPQPEEPTTEDEDQENDEDDEEQEEEEELDEEPDRPRPRRPRN